MTIDEAIKHYEAWSEENEAATKWQGITYTLKQRCAEQASDYKQLAKWLKELKERRTADVQPVKRGRWVFTEKLILGNPYGSYKCSECMYHVPHEDNYCPNCGADMRGEDNG